MSDCKLLVYRSSVRLDNSFKREIMDTLKMDEFYSEIINELEIRERNEIVKKNETYRKKNELLVVYLQNQLDSVNYWRLLVSESLDIKIEILTECHDVPYSAHLGIQRTLNKVSKSFYWKGQTGDVRTL